MVVQGNDYNIVTSCDPDEIPKTGNIVNNKIIGFSGHVPNTLHSIGVRFAVQVAQSEQECVNEKEKTIQKRNKEDVEQKKLQEIWLNMMKKSGKQIDNKRSLILRKQLVSTTWLPPVRNAGPKREPRIDYRKALPYEYGITSKYGGHIPGRKYSNGITAYETSKYVRTILDGGDFPEFKI